MGQKAREIMMKDEQEQHGEYVKMGEVYLISEETVEKATDFTVPHGSIKVETSDGKYKTISLCEIDVENDINDDGTVEYPLSGECEHSSKKYSGSFTVSFDDENEASKFLDPYDYQLVVDSRIMFYQNMRDLSQPDRSIGFTNRRKEINTYHLEEALNHLEAVNVDSLPERRLLRDSELQLKQLVEAQRG